MEKVALFIDVQNIYYTVRQKYNCQFDYHVLWRLISAKRTITKAIAYATDKGDERQAKFQNVLRRLGFEVKLKPYIQRQDGSTKGDWDVGIALDMVRYAQEVDVVILASGDGDFSSVVDQIRADDKKRVEVYGVPSLTALGLIQSADHYYPIEDEFLIKPR